MADELDKVELSEKEQAELREELRVLEYEMDIYNAIVKKKQIKVSVILDYQTVHVCNIVKVLLYSFTVLPVVCKFLIFKADEIRVKLGAKLASDFVKQTKEKLFEIGHKIGEKIEEIQENEEFKEMKKSASEFIVNKYKEIEEMYTESYTVKTRNEKTEL